MAHRQWVDKGDGCSAHLKDCKDGYSFSLWEKNSYDTNTMVNYGLIKFQQKYIVSSGVEYDLDKGTACPGWYWSSFRSPHRGLTKQKKI